MAGLTHSQDPEGDAFLGEDARLALLRRGYASVLL